MSNSCEQCKILRHQIHIHEINNQNLLEEMQHYKEEAESDKITIKTLEEELKKYRKAYFDSINLTSQKT